MKSGYTAVILLAAMIVSLPVSPSCGLHRYGSWDSPGGRETLDTYYRAERYAAKARGDIERARNAVGRTERAALRAPNKNIDEVEEILERVKGDTRLAESTYECWNRT